MDAGNIKVFVRVRPPNQREQSEGLCIEHTTDTDIKVRESVSNPTALRFSFDRIFDGDASQKAVFDVVGRSLISNVFDGINGTTFTYGQTASGKTYTCMGPDAANDETKGLIPRVIDEVFKKIAQSEGVIEFCLKVSLVEIYQERVRDLLDATKFDLKIRENKAKGIYIQDATQKYVASAAEVLKLLQEGSENRSLGHTNMNEASSRSHMVFILTVHQNNLRDLSAKSAKLILVDLAGSEKVGRTGAQGKLLDEAKHINKSLSALGNVINSLTETKIAHVPYRDSKLTRILQESLGGNAKTNLIINLSPSILNESETISTLRFGHRAKNIRNKPKVNKQYTVPQLLLLLEKAELRIQEQDNIIKKLLSGQDIDDNGTNKKSTKDVVSDNSEDQHREITEKPERTKKLKSVTYVSPLQEEYTEGGLEAQPEQRQLIDIRLLEMQIASEKKKSARTRCELHRVKMENTELNRENVLLIERYNACTTELERLQSKFDQTLHENSELNEKQSTVEEQLQALTEENCSLKEAAQAYSQIQQQAAALKRASIRDCNALRLFGSFKPQASQEEQTKQNTSQQAHPAEQGSSLVQEIRKLESELKAFSHLRVDREKFEKEKLDFINEKSALLSDLENRIFKVIELEEELDFEKSKRIHLQQTVEMSEKNQASKITALEGFISELTASYYVLKNQELCWKTENRLFEQDRAIFRTKIKRLTTRIEQLERELKETKTVLNEQKSRLGELDSASSTTARESILKPNYDSNVRRNSGNDIIIKIVRPQPRTNKIYPQPTKPSN